MALLNTEKEWYFTNEYNDIIKKVGLVLKYQNKILTVIKSDGTASIITKKVRKYDKSCIHTIVRGFQLEFGILNYTTYKQLKFSIENTDEVVYDNEHNLLIYIIHKIDLFYDFINSKYIDINFVSKNDIRIYNYNLDPILSLNQSRIFYYVKKHVISPKQIKKQFGRVQLEQFKVLRIVWEDQ